MFFGVSRVFYLKEKSNTFIPTIRVGHQDTGILGHRNNETLGHWVQQDTGTLGAHLTQPCCEFYFLDTKTYSYVDVKMVNVKFPLSFCPQHNYGNCLSKIRC